MERAESQFLEVCEIFVESQLDSELMDEKSLLLNGSRKTNQNSAPFAQFKNLQNFGKIQIQG